MSTTSKLAIHPSDHFHRDEIFRDCWNVTEKEKILAQDEQRKIGMTCASDADDEDSENIADLDVPIPWKWNNMGRIKEFFGRRPLDSAKSIDVDTKKWSYQILLDVKYFTPEELEITLTDRTVVIKGTQEEKENEDGAEYRHFTRKYILPSDVAMERIACHLSADKVLHINAPRTFEENYIVSAKEELQTGQEAQQRSLEEEESISLIQTLSDFDMIPFWARELPTHTQFGNKSDMDNFKVVIDLGQFEPEEVDVYCAHNYVKVEAKHVEKEDAHGLITRHFIRKYWLPHGVTPKQVTCNLSRDGVLEVMAPNPNNPKLRKMEDMENPVRIPIVFRETKVGKISKKSHSPILLNSTKCNTLPCLKMKHENYHANQKDKIS